MLQDMERRRAHGKVDSLGSFAQSSVRRGLWASANVFACFVAGTCAARVLGRSGGRRHHRVSARAAKQVTIGINPILCGCCDVPLSGTFQWQQHILGRKHIASVSKSAKTVIEANRPFCTYCDIEIDEKDNPESLALHLASKGHLQNVKTSGGPASGAPPTVLKAKAKASPKQDQKSSKKAVNAALRNEDIVAALDLMRKAERKTLDVVVPRLLELAARVGSDTEYAAALAACVVELRTSLEVSDFVKLLGVLTGQLPVPNVKLRLTLNLAVPKGGQSVPIVGPGQGTEVALPVTPAELHGCVVPREESTAEYFGHFVALLHLEFLEELTQVQRRLERDVSSLEGFGWMVRGLEMRNMSEDNRMFLDLPPGFSRELRMRPGNMVLVSREDPLRDGVVGMGTVVEAPAVDEDGGGISARSRFQQRIVVALEAPLSKTESRQDTWRLDAGANYTTYRRQLQALTQLAEEKDAKRWPLWDLLVKSKVGGDNIDSWASKLREREQNHGQDAPGSEAREIANALHPSKTDLQPLAAMMPHVSGQVGTSRLQSLLQKLQNGAGTLISLNTSQREAVAAALTQQLTLVQGPPGTGKTYVSVQILRLWNELGLRPLLATSDSNIAVDNIAENALKLGLRVVRIGRSEKVNGSLDEFTLDALVRSKVPRFEGRMSDDERKEFRNLEYMARIDVIRSADVICATAITAASGILKDVKFDGILFDEAAQSTELSAIVPLVLCGAFRAVLVGDQCQLPPSTLSRESEARGLSLSLFSRMLAEGVKPHFLDTQFRMHPMIAEFSSQAFYDGQLRTGIDPLDRPAPRGIPWPRKDVGVAFLNCPGLERSSGESRSNDQEANYVADILATVLAEKELSVLEVGVVTPYSAQVRALRVKLRNELPNRLRGTGVDLTAGLTGRQATRALEIASVDAFQGREKELIIFSAVRSNRGRQVGFLADWRRLNVLITRAKRGLLIIGNRDTLKADPSWARWLDWADENGLMMEAPAPSRRAFKLGIDDDDDLDVSAILESMDDLSF